MPPALPPIIYLDNNCYGRLFDDQEQQRVAEEAEAVTVILSFVGQGEARLAWSAMVSLENRRNPDPARRLAIERLRELATVYASLTLAAKERARALQEIGLQPRDSVHVALAEHAGCDAFLTCDDPLIKRSARVPLGLKVLTPVQYLANYGRHRHTRRE